jgi:hypothetical protein
MIAGHSTPGSAESVFRARHRQTPDTAKKRRNRHTQEKRRHGLKRRSRVRRYVTLCTRTSIVGAFFDTRVLWFCWGSCGTNDRANAERLVDRGGFRRAREKRRPITQCGQVDGCAPRLHRSARTTRRATRCGADWSRAPGVSRIRGVAAGKLFHAIERGAGVNDAERTRFFQAFLVAKNQTCRLDVIIVQNGVKLEFDGEEQFSGRREFWVFVKAGKHKLHASLEGFEDQTIEIDASKGGQLPIKIELRPVKPTEEPAKQPDPEPTPKAGERPTREDKPAAVIVENKPSALTNPLPKNGSFVFGLGLGFVFGATPTPAMGPHAFVAWRSRSWWEVGVDARFAWTFVEDERFPTTRFVTWSALLVPCGRWKKPWFACGILELDGVQRSDRADGRLLAGIGLRGGVEFKTHEHLSIQLVGDVVAHRRGFDFRIPVHDGTWTGSFVTGTLAVRAVIKP